MYLRMKMYEALKLALKCNDMGTILWNENKESAETERVLS